MVTSAGLMVQIEEDKQGKAKKAAAKKKRPSPAAKKPAAVRSSRIRGLKINTNIVVLDENINQDENEDE